MYACFATQEAFGIRTCEFWVLEEDQQWHDAVSCDGGSYSPDGPGFMSALPGETREQLEARAAAATKAYEAAHPEVYARD